jgi:branched-chain amino acid transport system permease protein
MRSDFGRALRAIHTDQTAALSLGVDVPRYKLYAFLIGAAFASISGSLLAFDFHFISPTMVSTDQSFLLVTMLIIGGEATLVGPVIGVILLTLLPTLFQFLDTYKTMASGLLLVAALLYFPSGLYGGFTSLVRRLSGTPRTPSPTVLTAD